MTKRFLFLFIIPYILYSQKKQITLEEIWTGKFNIETIKEFKSAKNNSYTQLNYESETKTYSIDKYDFKTQEKTTCLFSSKDFKEIKKIHHYEFNNNENKLLIASTHQKIYRHSYQSVFYIYDILDKKIEVLDNSPIQEPSFSPDGKSIAYVRNNNIFVYRIDKKETIQLTKDGEYNHIINGITDWVNEEEFSFVKAYEWSTDSQKIAYLKFDESNVPSHTMSAHSGYLYTKHYSFKYPKPGQNNSKVSVHVTNIHNQNSQRIDLTDYEYIPKILWSKKNNQFGVITLNRHQNNIKLHLVDTQKNKSEVVLNESSDTYIDFDKTNYFEFIDHNHFIWTSEANGFNHLYLYNTDEKKNNQITIGNWEVTNFYGYDTKNKYFYYQSTEEGSTNRAVYKIKANGKGKKKLNRKTGFNKALFSKDYTYFIIENSDTNTPNNFTLYSQKKQLKTLLDNHTISEELTNYNLSKKEFSQLETPNGKFNMWMLKPKNFDPQKKYPLLMYQYSGPGHQSVENKWNSYNDYWFQLLVNKGFIVACVDGRGTGYRGEKFKKCTYLQLGKFETEDQIESAKVLGSRSYIDKERIGIWGWSFGGFMAANCIFKGNDVFKTAISVAPVTSWRYYNSIYTERFLRTPEENPEGYDNNSPLFFTDQLKGNFLLIHGTGDDNVHIQNAFELSNALIRNNKNFEQMIYPDRGHGIYRGKNTRLHLFTKMTHFLEKNL